MVAAVSSGVKFRWTGLEIGARCGVAARRIAWILGERRLELIDNLGWCFFFNWLKQWGSNQYTKSLQQPFLLLQKTLQVLDPVLSFFQDTLTAIQCHRGGKDCRWFQMIVDFICE